VKFPKLFRMSRWLWLVVVLATGCGFIADKDRIRIAKIDDEYITRGDLAKVIREMAPDERPIIRTRGDVRRALENYIDRTLKEDLAEELREQGKVHVDRERARQVARARNPEQFLEIKNFEEYGREQGDEIYLKQEQEYLVDEEVRRLEAEQAVFVKIEEAVESGALRPSDEEFKAEYELRKEDLKHFERLAFEGILIPGSGEASVRAATAVRGQLASGEELEAIVDQYRDVSAQVLESGLEHNPDPKYVGFWQQASGAQTGDILGPIFITGWEAIRQNAQGRTVAERLPDGLLVCRVTDFVPAVQKTLEEAKPDLIQDILYARMMDMLREQRGVEIYEDKLPDPSMYDTGQSIVQQQPSVTGG